MKSSHTDLEWNVCSAWLITQFLKNFEVLKRMKINKKYKTIMQTDVMLGKLVFVVYKNVTSDLTLIFYFIFT